MAQAGALRARIGVAVLLAWIASNAPGNWEMIRRLRAEPDAMADVPAVERLAPFLSGLEVVGLIEPAGSVRDLRRRYYAAQYALVPIALRGPWVGSEGLAEISRAGSDLRGSLCFCPTDELRGEFERAVCAVGPARRASIQFEVSGDWVAARWSAPE